MNSFRITLFILTIILFGYAGYIFLIYKDSSDNLIIQFLVLPLIALGIITIILGVLFGRRKK